MLIFTMASIGQSLRPLRHLPSRKPSPLPRTWPSRAVRKSTSAITPSGGVPSSTRVGLRESGAQRNCGRRLASIFSCTSVGQEVSFEDMHERAHGPPVSDAAACACAIGRARERTCETMVFWMRAARSASERAKRLHAPTCKSSGRAILRTDVHVVCLLSDRAQRAFRQLRPWRLAMRPDSPVVRDVPRPRPASPRPRRHITRPTPDRTPVPGPRTLCSALGSVSASLPPDRAQRAFRKMSRAYGVPVSPPARPISRAARMVW